MKISLAGLLAVLSTVGLTLAQFNYYDTTSTGSNNKDDNSDKDDNFTDYLLALLVGLYFINRFVKRKYNFNGSDNFINLRP